MTDEFSYYKINRLLWRWRKTEGARIVYEARLSIDKTPPPLPTQLEPKARPKPKPKPDSMTRLVDDIGAAINAFSRFKTWLNTPDPPKPAPVKQRKVETVPRFDIQEIPKAMRKEYMPVAAKLMERWFAGRLNYSPTYRDEVNEINQDGQPYPPDMYDMTTIKLDWVLKKSRAKAQFENLQRLHRLTTANARKAIRDSLLPYRTAYGEIDALAICKGDLRTLHKHFEFQFSGVESSLSQKIDVFIDQRVHNGGVPDDLTAALGSFNFYAAIGYARFNREASRATISTIVVYIKDNYTFTDKPNEPSQYLGHWSKNGIVIVPATGAAGIARIHWLDYPVTVGDMRVKGNVYYPVKNGSFRDWQRRHDRGGDFVVFSDHRLITLPQPIVVDFI